MRAARPVLAWPLFAALAVGCAGAEPVAQEPSGAPPVAVAVAAVPASTELHSAVSTSTPPPSGAPHPFAVDDMLSFQRVSEPALSPDGSLVAFTVGTPDLEANKQFKDVWLATIDGSSVRRLTTNASSDTSPRFAPDGKSIYFLSS